MGKRWISSCWIVFLFSCLQVGCIVRAGANKGGRAEVPANSPILLAAQARELTGKTFEDLVTSAGTTVEQTPFDSQLIRRVAGEASDAVVSIYTKTETQYALKILPLPTRGLRFKVPGEALGSGFFIHPSGYLLTNNHVIENATEIIVRTKSEEDYRVSVVARDAVLDLALLKVVESVVESGKRFPILEMGQSDDLAVGDWVIAIGNPLGLGHTVTHGIISQTGRHITPVDDVENGRHVRFLQTDTAINPGSSGGPLITLTGAWVGVNTAILVGSQGIGFSVPSIQVQGFLESVLGGQGQWENVPPSN